MPAKARKYRVFVKDNITHRWIPVATELSAADSASMVKFTNLVEVKREEIQDGR